MPLRVFIVTGTSYGVGAARPRRSRISPSRRRFHGSAAAAALAGHLGDRAAEVEVDVGDAVVGAEDLGGLADVRRVGAVELDRADLLGGGRRPASPGWSRRPRPGRGEVIISQTKRPGGEEPSLSPACSPGLLAAQGAVRRVGDAGHRREDHGHRGSRGPQAQGQAGHGSDRSQVEHGRASGPRHCASVALLALVALLPFGLRRLGPLDLAVPLDRHGSRRRAVSSTPVRSRRRGSGRGRPGRWSNLSCGAGSPWADPRSGIARRRG